MRETSLVRFLKITPESSAGIVGIDASKDADDETLTSPSALLLSHSYSHRPHTAKHETPKNGVRTDRNKEEINIA